MTGRERKGRVAEKCVGGQCAIAVLPIRRCKDHNLDVCITEAKVNAEVMR